MLARHAGAIALVSAAIPGELVDAEIENIQRGSRVHGFTGRGQ